MRPLHRLVSLECKSPGGVGAQQFSNCECPIQLLLFPMFGFTQTVFLETDTIPNESNSTKGEKKGVMIIGKLGSDW